jgi:hypothetical protein
VYHSGCNIQLQALAASIKSLHIFWLKLGSMLLTKGFWPRIHIMQVKSDTGIITFVWQLLFTSIISFFSDSSLLYFNCSY